jgi:hypothetical protein
LKQASEHSLAQLELMLAAHNKLHAPPKDRSRSKKRR